MCKNRENTPAAAKSDTKYQLAVQREYAALLYAMYWTYSNQPHRIPLLRLEPKNASLSLRHPQQQNPERAFRHNQRNDPSAAGHRKALKKRITRRLSPGQHLCIRNRPPTIRRAVSDPDYQTSGVSPDALVIDMIEEGHRRWDNASQGAARVASCRPFCQVSVWPRYCNGFPVAS